MRRWHKPGITKLAASRVAALIRSPKNPSPTAVSIAILSSFYDVAGFRLAGNNNRHRSVLIFVDTRYFLVNSQ
jgi:hypothetical protein